MAIWNDNEPELVARLTRMTGDGVSPPLFCSVATDKAHYRLLVWQHCHSQLNAAQGTYWRAEDARGQAYGLGLESNPERAKQAAETAISRPLLAAFVNLSLAAEKPAAEPQTRIDVCNLLLRQHLTGSRQEAERILGLIRNTPGPWLLDFRRPGYEPIPHRRFVFELAVTLALHGLTEHVTIDAPENPLWAQFDQELRWTASLLSTLTGVG